MAINQREWELLNAYADGELSADAVKAFELQLSQNQDLRVQLKKIATTKRALSKLNAEPKSAKVPANTIGWVKHAAAAAMLLLIGVTAFFWNAFQQNQALNPIELHTAYANKSYILSELKQPVKISSKSVGDFYIPDLQASQLQLADTQLRKVGDTEIISAHFRGLRGCRLTLVGQNMSDQNHDINKIQFVLNRSDSLLMATWSLKGSQFTLLASGMDANRFQTIAHYVQNELQSDHSKQREMLRIAMHTAYETARPCA